MTHKARFRDKLVPCSAI